MKIDKFLIIYAFIGLLAVLATPNFIEAKRPSARDKACLSNLRILQGAIEMYNMDNKTMIQELTEETMTTALKGYLKPLGKPDSNCDYKSKGDLSNDGIVYCVYHGDPNSILQCKFFEKDRKRIPQDCSIEDYKKAIEARKKENEEKELQREMLDKFMPYLIMALIGFIIISIVACIYSLKTKK